MLSEVFESCLGVRVSMRLMTGAKSQPGSGETAGMRNKSGFYEIWEPDGEGQEAVNMGKLQHRSRVTCMVGDVQ